MLDKMIYAFSCTVLLVFSFLLLWIAFFGGKIKVELNDPIPQFKELFEIIISKFR